VTELPFDELVLEVGKVRHAGVGRLRRLGLSVLPVAASAAGLDGEPHRTVELLIGRAIDGLGHDDYADATRALFGLAQGTQGLGPTERRGAAAKLLGKEGATLRRRGQQEIVEDVAREILKLATSDTRSPPIPMTVEIGATAETPAECSSVRVSIPNFSLPRSAENDYDVRFGGFADWQLAVFRSAVYLDDRPPLEVCIEGREEDRRAFELHKLRWYRKDPATFITTICESAVRFLSDGTGGYRTSESVCDLIYYIVNESQLEAGREGVAFDAWLDDSVSFRFKLSKAEVQQLERRTQLPYRAMTRNLAPLDLLSFSDHWGTRILPGLVNRWLEGTRKPAKEFFVIGNWYVGLA